MGEYVIAPAGANAKVSITLKNCIEYIGSLQPGRGSSLSKGKRSLRRKLGCSVNCVKLLYKPVIKVIGQDLEKKGMLVYKYHDAFAYSLIRAIVDLLIENASKPEVIRILETAAPGQKYIDVVYADQMDCLKWTRDSNYRNQYERATKIANDLDQIIDVVQDEPLQRNAIEGGQDESCKV